MSIFHLTEQVDFHLGFLTVDLEVIVECSLGSYLAPDAIDVQDIYTVQDRWFGDEFPLWSYTSKELRDGFLDRARTEYL